MVGAGLGRSRWLAVNGYETESAPLRPLAGSAGFEIQGFGARRICGLHEIIQVTMIGDAHDNCGGVDEKDEERC